MSLIPDQVPDDETHLAKGQDVDKLERALYRIPADVGVAARTFEKYAELAHPTSVGEESRVKTIEDVSAKMKAGGVDHPHLLFADIALSVLPDELVTPAVEDARDRLKQQNPSHGWVNTALAIELSAGAQPEHVIFQNPIQGIETPGGDFLHTNTKERAGIFSIILEQDASVYAIAREWNQSKTVEEFGKGIGPAVISAYESASKIVEDNPDPYTLIRVIQTMQSESDSKKIKEEIKREQKGGTTKWNTKYKYIGITMPSNITSRDIKPKDS